MVWALRLILGMGIVGMFWLLLDKPVPSLDTLMGKQPISANAATAANDSGVATHLGSTRTPEQKASDRLKDTRTMYRSVNREGNPSFSDKFYNRDRHGQPWHVDLNKGTRYRAAPVAPPDDSLQVPVDSSMTMSVPGVGDVRVPDPVAALHEQNRQLHHQAQKIREHQIDRATQ